MKKKLTLALLCIASLTGYAKEIRQFIVTTNPKMVCENCEKKIKGNLRFEKGVKKIETDLERQIVTVTYDADQTSEEKLKAAFGKLKYQVRKISDKENSSGKSES